MAALGMILGMLGSLILIPAALIPLFAGIVVMRKRVWSARGFAVYACAQVVLALVVLVRGASPSKAMLLGSALISALIAVLFFKAASNLHRAGAVQGRAFPWIALALITKCR